MTRRTSAKFPPFPLVHKKAFTTCANLSNRPVTPGQVKLQAKYGTPYAFCIACKEALGEISLEELEAAVDKYNKEWEAA